MKSKPLVDPQRKRTKNKLIGLKNKVNTEEERRKMN